MLRVEKPFWFPNLSRSLRLLLFLLQYPDFHINVATLCYANNWNCWTNWHVGRAEAIFVLESSISTNNWMAFRSAKNFLVAWVKVVQTYWLNLPTKTAISICISRNSIDNFRRFKVPPVKIRRVDWKCASKPPTSVHVILPTAWNSHAGSGNER